MRIIGIIVELGPKANAEDTVRTDKKTASLYLPKINPLRSESIVESQGVSSAQSAFKYST